jgi:hypothetical protein
MVFCEDLIAEHLCPNYHENILTLSPLREIANLDVDTLSALCAYFRHWSRTHWVFIDLADVAAPREERRLRITCIKRPSPL